MRYLTILGHIACGLAGLFAGTLLGWFLIGAIAWYFVGPYDIDGLAKYVIGLISFLTCGLLGCMMGVALSGAIQNICESIFIHRL